MYALVADLETYPEFLPWCSNATLHWVEGNELEGSVEMDRGGLQTSFRTRNTMCPNESIDMSLVEGPFSHLSGVWRFNPLGEDGSKVSLDMEFEVRNPLVDHLLGRFFEEICNSLVDAFVKRAEQLYGGAEDV